MLQPERLVFVEANLSKQSVESKLMAQIAADPDDDTPRLVMADWYEEQGDPRGQFIRAQCELERLDSDDPRYDELDNIVDQLIGKHRAKWVKQMPKLPGITWGNFQRSMHEGMWDEGRYYFRRGFVELLAIKDFKSLQTHLPALRQYGLASYVDIVNATKRCYETLYELPFLRGLAFFQQREGIDYAALGKMASRKQLRTLCLVECDLDQEAAEQLVGLDFPSLRAIDLHFNDLEDSIDTLCKWPVMKQLRWLNLGLNSLGGDHRQPRTDRFKRLMSEPALANLTSLSLWANDLGAKHFRAVAQSCSIKRLNALDLSSNHKLGDDGIAELVKLPIQSLRTLELSTTKLTGKGIQTLAKCSKLSSLRRLNVGHNEDVGDKGIAAIAESAHLAKLTHLNLARTNLGEKGAQALIDSETLQSIRYLNVGEAKLKDTTIKALQRRYPKAIAKSEYR
jgi:uncharacterized protein (TIGR02996 family)